MAKAKKSEQRRPVTRADFIGAKMSNFLFSIAHDNRMDEHTRSEAKKLYEQWDSVAVVRIDNPIVKAELEKALAAGELK